MDSEPFKIYCYFSQYGIYEMDRYNLFSHV